METTAGFPVVKVEFDKKADLVNPAVNADIARMIQEEQITDLLVLSHGWNNDMNEAQALYDELLGNIASLKANIAGTRRRNFGVLVIFWPSKKFADAETISGGAANLGSADQELLATMLDDLKGTFDAPDADSKLEEAKGLVPALEHDPAARQQFADLVRGLVVRGGSEETDASDRFFALDGQALIDRLSTTGEDELEAPEPDAGAATHIGGLAAGADTGQAEGLRDFFGGLVSGARNALNYVTYYQMKERAGLVGEKGLGPLMSTIRGRFPGVKVHLIGHSFGGRVVSAAAATGDPGVRCHSLTLLQAAFSHYGFSEDWDGKESTGLFLPAVANPARVAGPVTITCTRNDKAVGVAYAIASRLAGQIASTLGDENDKYGGMGRNGAQKTAATHNGELLEVGGTYPPFTGAKLFNLKADAAIANHGDVRNARVAYAVLSAVASV